MKVEFDAEEAWAMMNDVVDRLLELDLKAADRAAIRRWRSDEQTPGSAQMKLLTEKTNEVLQRMHDRSEVSHISKPDWV